MPKRHSPHMFLLASCSIHRDVACAIGLVSWRFRLHLIIASRHLLVEEFASAGLVANGSKTKLLTTDAAVSSGQTPLLVDLAGMFVEVIKTGSSHKYLGKSLPGDLASRGQRNLDHRLACAWMRFHEMGHTLMNHKIPVNLRLRLFNSVVSPTVLYSLSTTPLTSSQLERLDGVQRKMMRRIVGWVRHDEKDRHDAGHRTTEKLNNACDNARVAVWSQARDKQRRWLLEKVTKRQAGIVCRVYRWSARPTVPGHLAYRKRGRPACRWTDGV